MESLPLEVYGLPAGLLIIVLVGALKQVGLPKRYAGLAAIVLATTLGTAVLLEAGQTPFSAIVKGVTWGLAIVATRQTVVEPLRPTKRPEGRG